MRRGVGYPVPMSTLLWFRQDLRVADNPALNHAIEFGAPIVPVFIFAPEEEGAWRPGGASQWWLHHSLSRLDADLRRLGSRLIVRRADNSLEALEELARDSDATQVLWNRRYEPASVERDRRIKSALSETGLNPRSFNGALLHEPWEVKSRSNQPFQVFSAFWRHCLSLPDPQPPLVPPAALIPPSRWPASLDLEALNLLPSINWSDGIAATWAPGSDGAQAALRQFLKDAVEDYETARDRPAIPGTSRLSPHLHFGEISPREVWHSVRGAALARGRHLSWRDSQFVTELGWREFAHHSIYHYPSLPEEPWNARFKGFPWQDNPVALRAWQRGMTGYPIVDAGMRQLWNSGWMHNRVRMIAASFLVKDLMINWTEGARWFWDTLVDADLANNSLGWQWVAGCGADAAPYFRIFNPVLQATRFDPDGTYVRDWVPELAHMPREWIHQPWAAPTDVLNQAGVRLGIEYPRRLVDHDKARLTALSALAALKKVTPA
jgi:deoxyribodipyrimidine photo-lyase